ncbi:MAG: HD-GYP domain-containing protein [Luteimonas sp.]|nr:HD-GYP domain-containing protein [Luteimonas sp.]
MNVARCASVYVTRVGGTGASTSLKVEERRVAVGDLLVGMYVCRLDRDWAATPFPLQGVAIRSADDIAALAEYARYVFIDIEMGLGPPDKPLATLAPSQPRTEADIRKLPGRIVYHDTAAFDDELPRAREAQGKAAEFAGRILDDVRKGREIPADDVRRAVEPLVCSILRNNDAFFWIESLRKRDAYDYSHALNCSALAAAFGRHVGFPEDVLGDLASGGLLLDVGKLRIDGGLFARSGPLTDDETVQVRRHVELGLQAVDSSDPLPLHVQDMMRTHHEREDGSGYPNGLTGGQIPLLGRIAAVIDSYDAMTSHRSHRKAVGKHVALQELYRARGTLYSAEIVEQFMQCLSVYPTGSLVELSNGQVAVVMAQNAARRLWPRVMLLTTPDKRLAEQFLALDLMAQPGDKAGHLRIANTLEVGAYGLDPAELYL